LRHDPGKRHRQVVAERQIGLSGCLVLAALEDLEDQAVAFFAIFPEQRLDVLERRGLERLEALALVDVAHDAHHMLAAADVLGQEIPGAARRFGRHRHM
jgi:hypothetical protein